MKLPWYPRYMLAYANRTAHLSLTGHGIYTLLLDRYYLMGGPLTGTPKDLLRAIGAPVTQKNLREIESILKTFFENLDSKWIQKRADHEIQLQKTLSEKRRAAIKKRWEKANPPIQKNEPSNTNVSEAADTIVIPLHYNTLHNTIRDNLHRLEPLGSDLRSELPPQLEIIQPPQAQDLVPEKPPQPNPKTIAEILWGRGLDYLKSTGLDDKQARSLIGKWRKTFGDDATVMAISGAQGLCVMEPIQYITRTLNTRKANGKKSEPTFSDYLAGKIPSDYDPFRG